MISDLINLFYINYINVAKMTIFSYFKTGNYVLDTIISTIAIGIFSYMVNYIYENPIISNNFSIDDIKY